VVEPKHEKAARRPWQCQSIMGPTIVPGPIIAGIAHGLSRGLNDLCSKASRRRGDGVVTAAFAGVPVFDRLGQ